MVDTTEVARFLELAPPNTDWLAELSTATGPDVPLPDRATARELLRTMRVPEADWAEAFAAAPEPDRDPELWWLLQHCRRLLADRMGDQGPLAHWPDLPVRLGAAGRWFYLWVFVAATPALLEYHRRHGVEPSVTDATLADVGAKAVLRRRTRGAAGLDKQSWFTLHFRGLLYALGRLQFNVARVRADAAELPAGTPCLGTHIPEDGPMTPQACDASFAAAPGFFARHFGTRYEIATCTSWLLDDQLAQYLPDGSNIMRFQRRFRLLPGAQPADASIVEFVFRRLDADPAELPRDTTLQRAVADHLRAGRHWLVRTGYLRLPVG